MSKLMGEYHKRIRIAVIRYAPNYLEHKKFTKLSWQDDEGPIRSVFHDLWAYAKTLLEQSPFKRIVDENAKKTADSAKKQVAKALDLPKDFDADLEKPTQDLADNIYDLADKRMGDSLDRTAEVLDMWGDSEEPDIDDLDTKLAGGLDGIFGKALAGVALAYGFAWGDMNQSAQEQAGVTDYVWITMNDDRVRAVSGTRYFGYHQELEGEMCAWDDPPLTADKSTSGEPCHPGEDINCRCMASPIGEKDTDLLN